MKYTAITLALAGLLAAAAASCSKSEAAAPAAEPSATEILAARLDSVAKAHRFAYGHHDDTAYGMVWHYEPGRSDVLATAGDYPALMSWDLGLLEMGDSANLDGVPFDFIRREVAAQHARGGFNTVSWHLRNPATGGDSWDCSDSTAVARILADSALSAKFDHWCADIAAFFPTLTDSAGARIPVIFRPFHEHTGSWFWWGAKLCTPDEYRQLWARLRKAFDEAGVDNVLWAYSPDRVYSPAQYMERYPGDDMVDIMGLDLYHFDGNDGIEYFQSELERSLGIAQQAAAEHGKLLALTETGAEGLPVADWYCKVLLPVVSRYPISYMCVWRNSPDKAGHFYAPYPGHPGVADFKAFRDESTTVFASDFKNF